MAKEMFQESKENIVYIDGEFIRRSEAKVSVFDHSFLYGDGVFERLRIYKGRIFRLDDYVERTFDSAKAMVEYAPNKTRPQKGIGGSCEQERDNRSWLHAAGRI